MKVLGEGSFASSAIVGITAFEKDRSSGLVVERGIKHCPLFLY